jgi:outer membrane protein
MPPSRLFAATVLSLVTIAPAARAADAPEALTLKQAEETAVRNQPTMRQAHGLLEAAEGRVEQARAGYLPQVSLSATYERTTGNPALHPGFPATGAGTSASWDPKYNYYALTATGSQLIYDFGQTSNRWRAAGASRDAAGENTRTAVLQTLLNVRRAYFAARAQRDLVAVAEETVRNQDKHVEQTQAFVRTGIQPDINLATVNTALANAKVQLVTARNNFAFGEAQLAQAMGVPVGAAFSLSDAELPAVAGEDGPAAGLVGRALRARPEVANLANQRRAQELTVRALKGGYGPAVSAVGSFSDLGITVDGLVPNWYIGAALSWNLLQGGLTRGQVREARGTLENLAGQEDALKLQVQVDVEQGRLGVQAAKASIGAAEEAVVNARQQLTLAEQRYAHGLGNAVELSDAQVAYTSAQAQRVQASFNLASARAQLLAALGDQ